MSWGGLGKKLIRRFRGKKRTGRGVKVATMVWRVCFQRENGEIRAIVRFGRVT